MTTGIYALNFDNSKLIYIGQSINIDRRFKEHLYNLNKGEHSNKMLEAYKQYGLPKLQVLCICDKMHLDLYEDILIKAYNSHIDGLNTLDSSTSMPKPNNTGEKHGMSKYTDEQVLSVFKLLVEVPVIKFQDISEVTGISYHTISNIASLSRHTWLKEIDPINYSKLISMNGSRNIGRSANTSASKGIKRPSVLSPTGVIYSDIENVAKFMLEHQITSKRFYELLNGKVRKIMGWTLA